MTVSFESRDLKADAKQAAKDMAADAAGQIDPQEEV